MMFFAAGHADSRRLTRALVLSARPDAPIRRERS